MGRGTQDRPQPFGNGLHLHGTPSWIAAGLFVLLSIAMTFPLVLHMTDSVPSDLGDPLYNIWVMAWEHHKLGSGLGGFWNGNIFYPHTGTLLYADYFPALSLMALPLALIGCDILLAYNLLLIFSLFLGAFGAYRLVLYLSKSQAAAILSGLIFGFFPYNFAHISHLELLFFGWMSFCFLYLHKFFDKPTYRNLFGIGFFFIFQALTCAYYAFFLGIFVALFILYFGFKTRSYQRGDFWIKMGALGGSVFLALFPLFYPYVQVHQKMYFIRPLLEVKYYSAQLQHFMAVPTWNVFLGKLMGHPGSAEWQLYPGLIALILAGYWWISRRKERSAEIREEGNRFFFWWDIAALLFGFFLLQVFQAGGLAIRWAGVKWLSIHSLRNPVIILALSFTLRVFLAWRKRRHKKVSLSTSSLAQRFYGFAVIFAMILAFGPEVQIFNRKLLTGPYFLLYQWIPGFKSIRAPGRFIVLLMLGLSVLAGLGASRFLDKLRHPRQEKILAAMLGGLIILEYLSVPVPLARLEGAGKIPSIYSAVKALPQDSVLLELPMPRTTGDRAHEALYMYYSISHWKRLVNGYSGYFPPGYTVVREAMEYFPSPKTLGLLRNLGVDYVLVHTARFRKTRGMDISHHMNRYQDQVELVAETAGDLLYRLAPRAETAGETAKGAEIGDKGLWKAESNHNNGLTGLAFDGNPETAWTSGSPQKEGDYFMLDLGRVESLSRIEFIISRFPLDFPRGFILEGSLDGASWRILNEDSAFFPEIHQSTVEDFSSYRMEVSFERCDVRYLRIWLTKRHENKHWSFQEIFCFR